VVNSAFTLRDSVITGLVVSSQARSGFKRELESLIA